MAYGTYDVDRARWRGRYLTKDGEKRTIQTGGSKDRVKVVAERVDCDTPYVGVSLDGQPMVWLEDDVAGDLLNALGKALAILPTSK